jgi:hypothetical protein
MHASHSELVQNDKSAKMKKQRKADMHEKTPKNKKYRQFVRPSVQMPTMVIINSLVKEK